MVGFPTVKPFCCISPHRPLMFLAARCNAGDAHATVEENGDLYVSAKTGPASQVPQNVPFSSLWESIAEAPSKK